MRFGAIRFGAACLVGLYAGIGLFNWVTGLQWLAEFSLPLSMLGGLGLAISSMPTNQASPSAPAPQSSDENIPTQAQNPAVPKSTPAPEPLTNKQTEPSISFNINKNARP